MMTEAERARCINRTERSVQQEAERLLVEIYSFEIDHGTRADVAWDEALSRVGKTLSMALVQAAQNQSDRLGVNRFFLEQAQAPTPIEEREINVVLGHARSKDLIEKDSTRLTDDLVNSGLCNGGELRAKRERS